MLSTKTLAELIRRKHNALVELCEIGRRQQRIVDEGETALLLQLLSKKQTMISSLQQVERDMAPFQSEDPDSRVWPSAEERARCAQQAAECNRLLEEIVAMEKQSADRMTARRNEVAAQLQHVYTARQARDAYSANRSRV
jgi:flagellar biosynthesis/type III secretory pathway chaperone